MKLQSYLERIAFRGTVQADFPTLAALQKAHVCSVPFENLDVQMGRSLSTHIDDAYKKIVLNSRGGWCYEQNGLFGWVLSEIGFEVTRVSANVMREERGEESAASHLCLVVRIPSSPTKYLVDVGFGGSMIRPIALTEGEHDQAPYKLGLIKLDSRYWRFWEDPGDGRFTYDFIDADATESALAEKCSFLQTDSSSGFVLNLVAQRRHQDRHCSLRGRIFTVLTSGTKESVTIDSARALVDILATEFRLDVPEAVDLWPKVVARHNQLFGCDDT